MPSYQALGMATFRPHVTRGSVVVLDARDAARRPGHAVAANPNGGPAPSRRGFWGWVPPRGLQVGIEMGAWMVWRDSRLQQGKVAWLGEIEASLSLASRILLVSVGSVGGCGQWTLKVQYPEWTCEREREIYSARRLPTINGLRRRGNRGARSTCRQFFV